MRVAYMGTPEFAVQPLERLLQSSHEVVAVVTQPDRPVGRGRHLQAPPVKELATARGVPVLQPARLKGAAFDRELAPFAPDVIVVAAYGRILPPEVLALPRFGCINIHASLLPRWRGAAPIHWAIVNGDTRTGVTIMQMDEGLDTGAMIATEELDILPDDDAESVTAALSVIGADLLVRVLDRIEAEGCTASTPQDESLATYAPILKKIDGMLDWNLAPELLICRIMGMQPWPGAFSFLSRKPWKFLRAEPLSEFKGTAPEEADDPEAAPGTVTALVKGHGFIVKTGGSPLLVTQVQPQGKNPMSGQDVINGKLLKPGDEFISDDELLG